MFYCIFSCLCIIVVIVFLLVIVLFIVYGISSGHDILSCQDIFRNFCFIVNMIFLLVILSFIVLVFLMVMVFFNIYNNFCLRLLHILVGQVIFSSHGHFYW